MNNEELIEKIKNGEIPKAGIIRRTGAAKYITVTTQIDGETVVVPDVDLSGGEVEA